MDIRFSLATLPLISGNLNALAIKVAPSEYSAHLLLCCRVNLVDFFLVSVS